MTKTFVSEVAYPDRKAIHILVQEGEGALSAIDYIGCLTPQGYSGIQISYLRSFYVRSEFFSSINPQFAENHF